VIHAWAPWVWDRSSTKKALYKYTYLYLYLIVDVFRRWESLWYSYSHAVWRHYVVCMFVCGQSPVGVVTSSSLSMLLAFSIVCALSAVISAVCNSHSLPSASLVVTLTAPNNRLGELQSVCLSHSLSPQSKLCCWFVLAVVLF